MPMSGRCSSIAATNDGPSPTEPTTSWPASASSSWSPSRSSSESSATTTLMPHRDPRDERRCGPPAGERDRRAVPSAARTPLLEPGQAVALGGVGAADAVVLDRAPRPPPSCADADTRRRRGAAVLGDVGERLGDHEVDGGLDVRRQRARARRCVASTGTSLRASISPSAAARPRSTSSGGAMPRESERSSATVSRAWSSAASMVAAAPLGVLRPAGCSARPRSIVSRTSRCCGPSWMSRSSRRSDVGLGHPGGVAAALDAAYLVLQLGAAAQQHRAPGWRAARPPAAPPAAGCSSASDADDRG